MLIRYERTRDSTADAMERERPLGERRGLVAVDEQAFLLTLGARVRELRRNRGWTLEDLAHAADVHATHLSAVERGKRNPTVGVLAKLADALDVQLSAFFGAPAAVPAKTLRAELRRRTEALEAEELARLLRVLDALR
ncbi:MAG: helix-turn-helix domain-containing protein [Myxococcota bacterium]|jgi:transcriptional regulator with XRE-family HTH domain|nr:helix-turn-helix domain-containing protein [Myxococcota bacterium]